MYHQPCIGVLDGPRRHERGRKCLCACATGAGHVPALNALTPDAARKAGALPACSTACLGSRGSMPPPPPPPSPPPSPAPHPPGRPSSPSSPPKPRNSDAAAPSCRGVVPHPPWPCPVDALARIAPEGPEEEGNSSSSGSREPLAKEGEAAGQRGDAGGRAARGGQRCGRALGWCWTSGV